MDLWQSHSNPVCLSHCKLVAFVGTCLHDRILEEKGEIEGKYAELEKKWRPFQVNNNDMQVTDVAENT